MSSQEVQKVDKKTLSELLADTDSNIMHALRTSVYPGAQDESIGMVLAYCKAKKYDPLAKAVHIVPMNVKDAKTGRYDWRDVIMPGIASYRIDAERTGLYVGISEPEYGPTITEKLGEKEVSYPEWCKVTVKKYNKASNMIVEFSAKEFWKENYANKGKDKTTGMASIAPNAMWEKRPFAQLAKCSEAQALRRAFADVLGSMVTFEEMEGKEIKDVTSIVDVIENVNCIDEEHLYILRQKMKEAGSEEINICNFLKIDCLESMLQKDFPGIVRQLERKISVNKKTQNAKINQALIEDDEETEKASQEFLAEMGEDE